MDELKPCPFCGGDVMMATDKELKFSNAYHWVFCNRCNVESYGVLSAEEARERWNTRPAEDALRARIAELEQALAEPEQPKPMTTLDELKWLRDHPIDYD